MPLPPPKPQSTENRLCRASSLLRGHAYPLCPHMADGPRAPKVEPPEHVRILREKGGTALAEDRKKLIEVQDLVVRFGSRRHAFYRGG